MRYQATAYGKDTRPEKPEGYDKMSEEEQKKAKKKAGGSFRTKNGVTKLGQSLDIDADTFGEAVAVAAETVAGMSEAAQKLVTKVQVELDETAPQSGGNPFEA